MSQSYQLSGQFAEACSCDVGCPCCSTGVPTASDCNSVVAWQIHSGKANQVSLDNLMVVGIFSSPKAPGDGGIEGVIYIDERATPDQQRELTAIFSGDAGGPPAALRRSVTRFHGVETAPVHVYRDEKSMHIEIPGIVSAHLEPTGKAVQVPKAKSPDAMPLCAVTADTSQWRAKGVLSGAFDRLWSALHRNSFTHAFQWTA